DREVVVVVRRREVRIRQHEHDGAHLRMNVAEHLNRSRFLERDRARRALGIAAEVESLATGSGGAGKREDVVIYVVLVWKIDRRSTHDGEHVRNEALVVLRHAAMPKAFHDGGGRGKLRGVALEIDDDVVELGERLVSWRRGRNRANAG